MYQPFVSVIVPAYNAAKTIAPCIESIVNQSYCKDRYEIIVVDNNSTDSTAEIIKSFPVRYVLENIQQSPAAARNAGIRHAHGEILAFTDSDCVADTHWLTNAITLFKNDAIAGVGGSIRPLTIQTTIEKYQARNHCWDQSLNYSPEKIAAKTARMITGNVFYRKCVFDTFGGFDCALFSGEDADLGFKVQRMKGFTIAYCDSAIIFHRNSDTLSKLWEQHFRYGYYRQILQSKHNPSYVEKWCRNGYIRPIYWFTLRTLSQLCRVIYYMIRLCLQRKPEYTIIVIDTFLRTFQQTAYFYGQLRSALKYKCPFFDLSGE